MISTCSGIVISSIPYSESSVICKVFTGPFGTNSFLIKGAKSAKSKKTGLLRPLQPIEITHYRSASTGLYLVKDISASFPLVDISSSPEKTCICLFLAEIISKTLSENLADEALYEFFADSVKFLEFSKENYVNFHLQFLLQYYRKLGFYPSLQELNDQGSFNRLDPQFEFLRAIISSPLYDNRVSGTNQDRKAALHWLLQFLKNQLGNVIEIKSLPVLESVFHF